LSTLVLWPAAQRGAAADPVAAEQCGSSKAPPTSVRINTLNLENDTTLSWQIPGGDPGATYHGRAGFEG
jgi:hypothetical protein